MGEPLTDLERRIDAVYDHFPKLTNSTVRAVCVFARDMLRDDEDDHRPDSMVGLAELYIEQAKRLAVLERVWAVALDYLCDACDRRALHRAVIDAYPVDQEMRQAADAVRTALRAADEAQEADHD